MSKDLYIPELKHIRQDLRNNPTPAEQHLWTYLRKLQLGYKFRRQVSIGYFVVDFYCKELALAIEVDGSIHNEKSVQERDALRQDIIETTGTTFLRITNDEVLYETAKTIQKIKSTCEKLASCFPLRGAVTK